MVDLLLSLSSFCYSIILSLLALTADGQQRSHGGEYCDTEVFRAECSEGELIVIERALYGRMKIGRCVEIDIGYLGCHRDVMALADRRCSGRRVCEIRIPDAEFESTRACLKELKTYLEVVYRCITPESINPDTCLRQDSYNVSVMTSHHSSGYLSSSAMSEVPICNRPDRPWIITVRPGQRINLTLYNFTPLRPSYPSTVIARSSNIGHYSADDLDDESPKGRHGSGVSTTSSARCRQYYGRIEDNGSTLRAPQRICGTEKRVEPLMISRGNTIRIWMEGTVSTGLQRGATLVNHEPPEPHRFLIQYTVVGCPNLDHVTDLAWFQRFNESRAVIQCRYSDARWHLHCHHGNWIGSYGNCSKRVETTTTPPTTSTEITTVAPPILYAEQQETEVSVQSESAARNIPATKKTATVIAVGLTTIVVVIALCLIIAIITILKQRRHQCVEPGSSNV